MIPVTGNRCGHNPAVPRVFMPPERHARRPGILRKLAQKIQEYYHHPRSTLPSLDLANGSSRQQRSERREACIILMGCLAHYLDLVTLRVGIPQPDGTFQGLTMEFLAQTSGLGLRRAERAIRDLVAAGIVTVHPITEHIADGVYRGRAAVRTISRHLFDAFGLGRWLRHEREKAVARRRRRQRAATAKQAAKLHLAVARSSRPPDRRPNPPDSPPRPIGITEFLQTARILLNDPDPPH